MTSSSLRTNSILKFLILTLPLGLFQSLPAVDDPLVAMGVVNKDGTLANSTNTVDGAVSVIVQGTGDRDIVVDAPGAFIGASPDDFAVELSGRGSETDIYVYGKAVSTTDDQLVVTIRSRDMEDPIDPNSAANADTKFNFLIRQIPADSSNISNATSFLIGSAFLSSTNSEIFGSDGISGTRTGSGGDYTVTFTKAGNFIADDEDDYVVIAQAESSAFSDRIVRVSQIDTGSSDDNVTIALLQYDVQDGSDGSEGTLIGGDIYFTVYLIPESISTSLPNTRLLIATANGTSFGTLSNAKSTLPNSEITVVHQAQGKHVVQIFSPTGFPRSSAREYLALASIRESHDFSATINTAVNFSSDKVMTVSIATQNVEPDGIPSPIAEDRNYSVSVYLRYPTPKLDMQIGSRRSISRMKGDDIYNSTGAGQKLHIPLPIGRNRLFYFTTENDGLGLDDFTVQRTNVGHFARLKFLRLTGGRKNVTAAIRRGREVAPDVRPNEAILFQCQVKYRSNTRVSNRKLRLNGRTPRNSIDTVRADFSPSRR